MDHTLANRAYEYAELEQTVREIRERIARAAATSDADENDLKRAEVACREARARLIDATHRETR